MRTLRSSELHAANARTSAITHKLVAARLGVPAGGCGLQAGRLQFAVPVARTSLDRIPAQQVRKDARAARDSRGQLSEEREWYVDVGAAAIRRRENSRAIGLLPWIIHRQ